MPHNVAILHQVVKKLALIFYCVFRVFILLNTVLLGLTLYIMVVSKSGVGIFLFIIFFINFWIMMMFFCLLSMCIKMLFICMFNDDVLNAMVDDRHSWLFSIIFFPLLTEEDENGFLQAVSLQSFQDDQGPDIQPPNTDRLYELEDKWRAIWKESSPSDEKKDDPCIICTHPYSHLYPSHQGCVELSCSCSTLFHKKCVLEWFHFNQRQDQDDAQKTIVSCPSCRHVFTIP